MATQIEMFLLEFYVIRLFIYYGQFACIAICKCKFEHPCKLQLIDIEDVYNNKL